MTVETSLFKHAECVKFKTNF